MGEDGGVPPFQHPPLPPTYVLINSLEAAGHFEL